MKAYQQCEKERAETLNTELFMLWFIHPTTTIIKASLAHGAQIEWNTAAMLDV